MDLTIPDEGFGYVTIGDKRVELDLWDVNNRMMMIHMRVKADNPGADEATLAHQRMCGLCDLLAELGFGRVSHFAADRFEDAIFKAVSDLGKTPAVEPKPD